MNIVASGQTPVKQAYEGQLTWRRGRCNIVRAMNDTQVAIESAPRGREEVFHGLDDNAYEALCHTAIEALVTVGLVQSVIARYPAEVQDNFEDRINQMRRELRRHIEEVKQFGEAWDDEVEEDEE